MDAYPIAEQKLSPQQLLPSYISIGYFEAYNLGRPCLNMNITTMDLSPYTHIHLAFGHVTTSWAINVSHIQVQWELFKEIQGVKKNLSLGGWSFSTQPASYSIFRDSVKSGNQDTFVANIISSLVNQSHFAPRLLFGTPKPTISTKSRTWLIISFT
jgi:hypothetical protein